MGTRNSTGASRAASSRRHIVAAAKTGLAEVPKIDTAPRRITFTRDGGSLIGSLLTLQSRLPSVRYDPSIEGARLDVDEAAKADILEELSSSSFAVTRLLKRLAGTMTEGDHTDSDVEELGFAIHGLAHMLETMEGAALEINEAAPAGVNHADV
jgi:hypothetical protein